MAQDIIEPVKYSGMNRTTSVAGDSAKGLVKGGFGGLKWGFVVGALVLGGLGAWGTVAGLTAAGAATGAAIAVGAIAGVVSGVLGGLITGGVTGAFGLYTGGVKGASKGIERTGQEQNAYKHMQAIETTMVAQANALALQREALVNEQISRNPELLNQLMPNQLAGTQMQAGSIAEHTPSQDMARRNPAMHTADKDGNAMLEAYMAAQAGGHTANVDASRDAAMQLETAR